MSDRVRLARALLRAELAELEALINLDPAHLFDREHSRRIDAVLEALEALS